MKMSSLKMVLRAALVVAVAFVMQTAVFAGDSLNTRGNAIIHFDIAEELQSLGLTVEVEVAIAPLSDNYSSIYGVEMPHIGRLAPEAPIIIASEADVDILLTFARIAVEQGFSFSWDSCVDTALEEANLYSYWREGFWELTRAGREQELTHLATTYTLFELVEMGLFDRYGMMEEFNALGFFIDLAYDYLPLGKASIAPFNSLTEQIPSHALLETWHGNIRLFRGDLITYTLTYSTATEVWPLPHLRVGIATAGIAGLLESLSHGFTVGHNPTTATARTIHNTSDTANIFRIINGSSQTRINISGSYRVTW